MNTETKVHEHDMAINALKPKTGWRIAHGMYEDRFWCSCGFIKVMDSSMSEWKYCPVCGGARMVSE